jgi:hypothetical protein
VNLRVGNFLTSCATISVSRNTLLHVVNEYIHLPAGTLHTAAYFNLSTAAPAVTPVTVPTAPNVSPTPRSQYDLGDLMSGTYCSRLFTDCDRKTCRLQSPNFPGIYPRNLTCYYAVRQHDVPAGKQALIVVRQPEGHLVAIRSQSALYGPSSQQQQQQHRSRELKVRHHAWR